MKDTFIYLTVEYPLISGFVKFAVLATLGELLIKRDLKRIYQRAFVWGCLGILITFVFPIYSYGVDALISKKMLPVFNNGYLLTISNAFWKSTWMNMIFAFPMMTAHRITDMLIDKGALFSKWDIVDIWHRIDWRNMWKVVAPSILWFWIPAHTITFCLAPEYRIIMAACLSICLGAILAFAKGRSKSL
ncbi:MAG: hypothetical protein WCQ47_07900 [bacterium]